MYHANKKKNYTSYGKFEDKDFDKKPPSLKVSSSKSSDEDLVIQIAGDLITRGVEYFPENHEKKKFHWFETTKDGVKISRCQNTGIYKVENPYTQRTTYYKP